MAEQSAGHDSGYWMADCVEKHPTNDNYCLHTHPYYEIYMFLEGDSKFMIEERAYSLDPGDVVIIRRNVMHRIYHNSSAVHSRIVIDLYPHFFVREQCQWLERRFLSTDAMGDKISAEFVKKSGLFDAFMRLKKYTNGFSDVQNLISKTVLIEMLCIIDKIDTFSASDVVDERAKAILKYVNRYFTKNLTLDDIAEQFFVSKYHLCRMFSKATGMTVHKYITSKRLALANDMMNDGMTADEAATLSGFNSYSAFYRAYCKEYGSSPGSRKI